MKLKNIMLAAGVLAIVFISCKKIEIQPTGQVPPDKAIKSEADVLAILNGMYTPFRGDNFYGGRLQIVSELMADVVDGTNLQGDYLVLNRFTSGGGTATSGNLYREPYIITQRANVALENLGLLSETNKKNSEGQAKFMRALSLFEMVKLYAQPYGSTGDNSQPGLVIKTTSTQELALKRNTVKEVYDQIIADLKSAETLLPATNGNYPGNLAAKAILARVYFQMNDFANAYNYANQVITSNQFSFDNTANFITNRFSDPKTNEAVWWIINEPGLGASFGPLRNSTNPNISMGLPITKAAYDESRINPNDLRRNWYKDSTAPGTTNTTYGVKKYNKNLFVLPVIHITELKLIRAESAAELNQNLPVAIADINDITNRAYAGTLPPLTALATAATIKQLVRKERRFEMVFESGDRLQQIKRIGAKGEASFSRTAPWNCNGMILQFPATEISVNVNFEQNPTGGCN